LAVPDHDAIIRVRSGAQAAHVAAFGIRKLRWWSCGRHSMGNGFSSQFEHRVAA
jgi:hypothetical protein